MSIRVNVQRHNDRVSTSFCEDKDDVECIVTVTFDNAVVAGLDDAAIADKARSTLTSFKA